MTTGSLAIGSPRCVLELSRSGYRAARLAAGLTVGGAVSLGAFFAVGEPWGTINDGLSIALAAATLPIAIGLARRNPRSLGLALGAGLDVIGVAVATAFTSLLIARRMTFEASLSGILGGQALIGGWLILVGVAAWSDPSSWRLAAFAAAGGAGLVAGAVGAASGEMGSPLAFVGFVSALVGTIGFYGLMGRRPRREWGSAFLPYGGGLCLLATLYIGYPLLALRLGRSPLGRTGYRAPLSKLHRSSSRSGSDASRAQPSSGRRGRSSATDT